MQCVTKSDVVSRLESKRYSVHTRAKKLACMEGECDAVASRIDHRTTLAAIYHYNVVLVTLKLKFKIAYFS